MTKRLLRLLRIAPLALLFGGIASAQTTGTIIGVVTDASTGKPVAGAVVIATSPNLQGEQTAVTDGNGNYRLVQLPPGEYKLAVQLEGFKPFERSDIVVRTDKTIRTPLSVVPEAVQMEEQVVRTGAAPVVNVGSAESGAVVSQEFITSVPVGRGFDQIAAVVPTARFDPVVGIGFAGAQAPENQYIIDGLNTTDPAYGTRVGDAGGGPPALRSNFTQELDIKTGGFGAEYGRATGGVLNVVLKSGSNEYHGSAFSTFSPNFLVEPTGKTLGASGEAIGWRRKADEGAYQLDYGFELGGPILKDKLWFFAGFAPIVTENRYERFIRQNVTPTNAGGSCPDGYTPDGAYGQCVDAAGLAIQSTVPGTEQVLETNRTTYQWLGKLTYLLDENNNFSVTGWGAQSSVQNLAGGGFLAAPGINSSPSHRYVTDDDGQVALMGRYGGKFLDKRLITDVQAGWYRTYQQPTDRTVDGLDVNNTPVIEYVADTPLTVRDFSTFEAVPGGFCDPADPAACPLSGYSVGGRGFYNDYTTDRFSAKASAAYLFEAVGQHNIKGGIDLERVQYEVNSRYTGNAWYVYSSSALGLASPVFYAIRGYGTMANVKEGAIFGIRGLDISDPLYDPADVRHISKVNTSETDSFAYFLQDSWQPSFLPSLTLNAGLRLETQSMKNLDIEDSSSFEINDNWSPRIQAIWDFTGTGRGKVAGSWGRFYYAMPLDMGDRSFGSEIALQYRLNPASCGFTGDYDGFDPRSVGTPFTGGLTSTCAVQARGGLNNDVRLNGGLTPVDPDLEGQFVDQFGAQVEYEVLPDLSVGVEYQGRRQGNVIEDMSANDGDSYFIGNPGKDRSISGPNPSNPDEIVEYGNSSRVTTIDPATGKLVDINFPDPERSYDGVTLRVTKNFSQNWLAQASYTYSVLRGNYSGPYYPEYGQLDPGITAEYDLASLMGNKSGYLPGDQTHAIKLFGAYTWNFGPRVSATASGAYTGASGTPVSALGSHPLYGSGSAFIIPRGQAGRTPFINTVDVGGSVNYVFRAPYAVTFRVDVFNLFNSQEIQEIDQNYTFDTVTPVSGLNCDGKNAVNGSGDPIAKLQADCPNLALLKTVDGRPVTVNPNFGKADNTTRTYQLPISMRFSLALAF